MRLAWLSESLRAACCSEGGLARGWPQDSEVAKVLLAAVAHAHDLNELRRLRSVEVRPTHVSGAPGVSISMEEVQMHAAPLTASGARIEVVPPSRLWSRAGEAPALLVHDLRARGSALVRVTS